ncbi:MAG: GIY-YIG nuclease family protein [Schleiferiaceae bacterium]|nr:GIY-YIG nuclease family protein [Schleiferiaceae bacterium]
MSASPLVCNLYSERTDQHHIGSTVDLDHRVYHHNHRATPSTKAGSPWRVVHAESLADLKTARARERAIKRKKSRRYIEWLTSPTEKAQGDYGLVLSPKSVYLHSQNSGH